MKLLKRHARVVLASSGILFVFVGLLGAYWWCYKLAPMRRLADPSWLAGHSENARWAEEQKNYKRMGSSPDLCFRGDQIGHYGDKQWFLWLEERIQHPEEFRHCGCTDYALALMSNHQLPSWGEWTEKNRGRSQDEWIRDGFRDYGVTIHFPPQPDDSLPLLKLLGRSSWNFLWAGPQGTNAPEAVPSYIQYNAYRWLRDSGFNPEQFALTNTSMVGGSDIARGLQRFSKWRAAYPGRDGLGVLAFGRKGEESWEGIAQPLISKKWVVAAANGLIAILLAGGLMLVLRSTKKQASAIAEESNAASSGNSDTLPGESAESEK